LTTTKDHIKYKNILISRSTTCC